MIKPKPDIIKIAVSATDKTKLVDKRLHRNFSVFGNIMDVARQYGIKNETPELSKEIVFSAPKSRMQIFVEKLHFSGVNYKEINN